MDRGLTTLLFTGGLVAASACTTEEPKSPLNGSSVSATSPAGGGATTTPGGEAATKSSPGSVSQASAVGPDAVSLGPVRNGIATFYDADGSGNCGFDPSPNDLLVVAPNKERYYDGSAICGACMRVSGPNGSVTVRVTDSCPNDGEDDCGNSGADLDLSEQAFAAIDNPKRGVSHVSFQLVPCEVTGPMRFRFKSGSSRSWAGIQVLNHRLPIAKLEFASGGGFTEMPREDDDYFIAASGVGKTPNGLRLRVTASTGAVVEDTIPGVEDGETVDGTQQFP